MSKYMSTYSISIATHFTFLSVVTHLTQQLCRYYQNYHRIKKTYAFLEFQDNRHRQLFLMSPNIGGCTYKRHKNDRYHFNTTKIMPRLENRLPISGATTKKKLIQTYTFFSPLVSSLITLKSSKD